LFARRAVKKIARDLSESKFAKIRVAKTNSHYQITDSDYEFANSWDDPYFGPYFAKIRHTTAIFFEMPRENKQAQTKDAK
jgi:hypothetical protein